MKRTEPYLNNLKEVVEFILPGIINEPLVLNEQELLSVISHHTLDGKYPEIKDVYSYKSLYVMLYEKYGDRLIDVVLSGNIKLEDPAKQYLVLQYICDNKLDIDDIIDIITKTKWDDDPIFMYCLLTKSQMRLENYQMIDPKNTRYLFSNSRFYPLYSLYCYKHKIPMSHTSSMKYNLNAYSLMAYNYGLVEINESSGNKDLMILYSLYQEENKQREILENIKGDNTFQNYSLSKLKNNPKSFIEYLDSISKYTYISEQYIVNWANWIKDKNDISEEVKKKYIIKAFGYIKSGIYALNYIRITGYYNEMDDAIKHLDQDCCFKYEIITHITKSDPSKGKELAKTLSKHYIIRYITNYGHDDDLFAIAKDSPEAEKYIQDHINKIKL